MCLSSIVGIKKNIGLLAIIFGFSFLNVYASKNNINEEEKTIDNIEYSTLLSESTITDWLFIFILLLLVACFYFLTTNKTTRLKIKIKGQILFISFALITFLSAVGLVSWYYMDKIGKELNSIAYEDIPLTKIVSAIETHQLEQAITVERVLKHYYDDPLINQKKINQLKIHFKELLNKSNKEIKEGEELCEEVILHEKNELVINEFKYVLSELKAIEKEHDHFNKDVLKLFTALDNNKVEEIHALEKMIEKEENELDEALIKLLIEIEKFTEEAAIKAKTDENKAIVVNIFILLIALISGTLLSINLSNRISYSINKLLYVSNNFKEGNLNVKVDLNNHDKDEIADLNTSMHTLTETLRNIVSEIVSGAENIASASQQLSSVSQQLSQGANVQASSTEEVSASMQQMISSIENNTDNSLHSKDISQNTSNEILNISQKTTESLEAVKTITDKIKVINDIAFQTNILALNASVEASRAGNSGKGFAVVATEVRKLAENSKLAAEEIVESADITLNVSEDAESLVNKIIPEINKVFQLIEEITSNSLEQKSGSSEINDAVQNLNQITQENVAASEELATSAEELASQAEQLKATISFFKVNEN